jgi:cell division protein FtsZ
MENAGSALIGIGYGTGESRAADAARKAIDSPLLELSIDGAKGLLFNITGGNDLSMFEVEEASRIITEACDPNANIKFGTSINESYAGDIKITVVATGFNEDNNRRPMERSGYGFGATPTASTSSAKPAQKSMFSPIQTFGSPHNNTGYTQGANAQDDRDLDVPAFLRNKK